jgi:succinate dehydrogenase hydrophobic anchor subunit
MTGTAVVWLLLAAAFIAANLPWLSERFLLVLPPPGGKGKRPWMRLLEWLILYFLIGFLALGLEKKATGQIHSQDWEFYAVGLFLFAVFAIPGFIWRHQLRPFLRAGSSPQSENDSQAR